MIASELRVFKRYKHQLYNPSDTITSHTTPGKTLMFAHYTQGSNNLLKAASFYDALLAPLGILRRGEVNDEFICYLSRDENAPKFFLVAPFDNNQATVGNGSMIAFTATNRAQVDESYQNGIDNGGTDEGAPGNRPQYADGYYGAYLRDLDGNKLHIVYRGDLTTNPPA